MRFADFQTACDSLCLSCGALLVPTNFFMEINIVDWLGDMWRLYRVSATSHLVFVETDGVYKRPLGQPWGQNTS